jgi:hypothetical protein
MGPHAEEKSIKRGEDDKEGACFLFFFGLLPAGVSIDALDAESPR